MIFTKIADSVGHMQVVDKPVFLSTLYLVDYQKLRHLALKKLVPAHTTDPLLVLEFVTHLLW